MLYHALSDEHEVLLATSGEPAEALARDKAPDAVLLDVTLPGIDGFEVCRRLKADALTRDIPVIFITSHDDLDIEAHGLDCGAVDFLTKPIHPRMLLARVKVHVTLKQHTDVLRGLVYIDGLTGLCNRRGFDERLTMEWQRAQPAATRPATIAFALSPARWSKQPGGRLTSSLATAGRSSQWSCRGPALRKHQPWF